MRDILFRGKSADNGEWVEGYYCPCCFGFFPCRAAIISADEIQNGCWKPEEVIPETVGQYTGLNDMNGTKIFEGDIVKEGCNGLIGAVVWDNSKGTYKLKDFGKGYEIENAPIEWEVIGNIHDNSELLEEGVDNA